jgi:hypothetical protein
MLLATLAISLDPKKSCTLSDHVLSCDRFCTTSLHQQVIGTISSLFVQQVAAFDSHDPLH